MNYENYTIQELKHLIELAKINNEVENLQLLEIELSKRVCFIDYLDCKNKFRETRKEFENYESAFAWMCETFDKPNVDFINYY